MTIAGAKSTASRCENSPLGDPTYYGTPYHVETMRNDLHEVVYLGLGLPFFFDHATHECQAPSPYQGTGGREASTMLILTFCTAQHYYHVGKFRNP
ncbi:hypothetical protein PoMZ_02798 [Pyricularia oryzae]|uniref:Uncharacterized protein n=1 Tax=Pyricularia oryzae TaxID=318829 RepID=A0A4P7N980_PYROR|nr:hypothetical protein PoMZ_02798 [Pyricularia oryzae]